MKATERHDCAETINAQLKEKYNTVLTPVISWSASPRELIVVATSKADSARRGKPHTVFASFCPFCGVKLEGV
jgi:hypothetical protein